MQAAQEPESQLQLAKARSLKNINSRLHGFCLFVYLLFAIITITKYLTRSNLREGEFIFGSWFRGTVPWGCKEGTAVGVYACDDKSLLTSRWIRKQKKGHAQFCCLSLVPVCIEARTLTLGVFPSIPGMSLISSIKLLWKHSFSLPHTHPEMCLQGYWRTNCLHRNH